ncbi:FecCD family ABC transporter permease [Winogradskyella aurantiaca]|uniref:FecCD family ABC transporter permease n=1 Tax=Winogradskyella aurantiaca TaxID=2219558 RepID=UPI000E1DAA4B|nr:iron ABC transporter permease [Winogradskyella aurantiaca]
MEQTNTVFKLPFMILSILTVVCFLVNISFGSVYIPLSQTISTFTGSSEVEVWNVIVMDYRLPKAITAILVGSGLGISGLLMQTLFRNPLAGPFVLGISSGASLGVAIIVLGSGLFSISLATVLVSKWGIIIAASLGSFLVLLAVLAISSRVRDTMAILIIGLMFGSITAALVSVLSYFSSAEQLQQYIFWGFGNLSNLSWNEILIFLVIYLTGLMLSIISIKNLNTLLLGDRYARSLGISLKQSRLIIILATSLLAGGITAFAGPIAFVGLAIPHLTRQLFKTSNHKILLPAVILMGAIVMLLCDLVAQVPSSELTLPINAITALVGAPVVIWILVKQRKMMF